MQTEMLIKVGQRTSRPDVQKSRLGGQRPLSGQLTREFPGEPIGERQDVGNSSIGLRTMKLEPSQLASCQHEGGNVACLSVNPRAVVLIEGCAFEHRAKVHIRANVYLVPLIV